MTVPIPIPEMPRVGEPFRPAALRVQTGGRVYPPAIVGRRAGVSDGQKRLYELLYQRAGENDTCWPSFETLAYDLGKSRRQVYNDMARLEALRLIQHEWRSGRRTNTYLYLWHEWFEQPQEATSRGGTGPFERTSTSSQTADRDQIEVQSTARQERLSDSFEVQSTALQLKCNVQQAARREVQSTANLKCSPLHTNSKREFSQGIVSSSSTEPTVTLSSTQASPASQPEMMTDAIQAEKTSEREKRKAHYPDAQIEQARQLLTDAHGTTPAFEQAKGILEAFRDYQHFRDWLDELCGQGRNRKLVSFAGYLTDAQRYAQRIRENNIEIPEWKGFRFKCKKCFDGGIVETEGESRWCSCETGQQKHTSLGDGYLAERMRVARETEDQLKARLAQVREKNKRPEPKPFVVPERTIEASPSNESRVLEAVACPHCGGQIVAYGDHIEDCGCHGKTRGRLEPAGQTLAAAGWVQ